MGFWTSKRGVCGDGWADEMGNCMKALEKEKHGEHEITMAEFADLVEFCSLGQLVVEVRNPEQDGDRPLSQLHCPVEV